MFRASKLFQSVSTSGPISTEKPSEAKNSTISRVTWVIGCRWPEGGCAPGSVTSIPRSASGASGLLRSRASRRAAPHSSIRRLASFAAAPARPRSSGESSPIPRNSSESEPLRPRKRARTSVSAWPEAADATARSASRSSASRSLLPDIAALRGLGLRQCGQVAERLRVLHGELGEDLAVDFHAGDLEPVDQATVRDAVLARGRVDARDPELAELALALLAIAIGVLPTLVDGFARGLEQAMARAVVALRGLENPVAPLLRTGSAFDSRHRCLLCAAGGRLRG